MITDDQLKEWAADPDHGIYWRARAKDLIADLQAARATRLTFEDEAGRLGSELQAERNTSRLLREMLTKPEADCEAPATCCLHKDGEG